MANIKWQDIKNAHDPAQWVAAKQAYAIARTELLDYVLSCPYDALPAELLALRKCYDEAFSALAEAQRERARNVRLGEPANDLIESPYAPPEEPQ
jgi:ApbE superfamily uncharacterized protein (UPF0280 family)